MKKLTTSKINRHFIYAKVNRRINVAKIVYSAVSSTAVPSNALLNEDGTPILTEDGNYILVE